MKSGKYIAALLLALVAAAFADLDVSAESYLYNRKNEAVEAPGAYTVSREITLAAHDVTAVSPQDIFCTGYGGPYYEGCTQ